MTGFNNHIIEFLDDIQSVFPENEDIGVTKNLLISFRKINPKLLIRIWHIYIEAPYNDVIDKENISFFADKDYTKEISNLGEGYQTADILKAIDRLRQPIKDMGEENQQKAMKYLKNLSKLSKIYID